MSHAKDDISALRSGLSETKRALLEKRLRGKTSSASEMERIPKRTDYGPAALSFAQQRLWFLDQLDPGKPFYNNSVGLRMRGNLNVEALKKSFDGIIARHEILRTTFSTINAVPVQVVSAPSETTIEFTDLSHLPEQPRELEATRLTDIEAQRPFDLSTGPLLRVSLLKLDQQEYVLLLNMHHIISDGWSKGILVEEFAEFYEAYVNERRPALPELGIQYADYAVWQRNWLQGESLKSQLAYWKDQLHDAAPALDLPTDRPRPALQSHLGAGHTFFIPEDLTRALKALSQRHGCTLFMTLLALFDVLLYRYSGQNDIMVGTPIANRNRVDIERLIGFFVNTLVVRGRVEKGDSFLSLLKRQREVALGAYANQDLPFEKLVEEIQPERSLSHTPLFQVMLALQNAPAEEVRLSGLSLRVLERQAGTAKFDLTMIVMEKAEGLSCSVEYSTDLFDEATIVRMAGHFSSLAEAAAADPDVRVGEMRMLAEEERNQLLYEFNRTDREYPRQDKIHEIFKHQAERLPDKVALSDGGRRLSYGELNRWANRVASYLVERGVGADTLVGLCMERSIEMVVAMLGVLKAGGAYLPLDPTYPKQRLEFMLEDAKPRVIICQDHLMDVLPGDKEGITGFEEMWRKASRYEGEEVSAEVNSQCLAYVIYTSGSTGKPKGVMNTHGAILNRLLWMQATYQLTETDRVLQKTPFSFDVSVWEFFWPLMTGASLVVAQPEGHKDSAYLVNFISEQQITTLHFVPSMLQVFLEERDVASCAHLKRVFCSGEALLYSLKERFMDRLNADLHNLYGPTEAAVDVTFWECERESDKEIVPIGKPIANTQIYLLDEHLHSVPIGVPGELHIGGVGLARGYLNRPDLTAEKFIPDPFSTMPDARLYKTGDLARYLPDGNIEFLGRLDFQVKIRGFRIELGEIESSLEYNPLVHTAVVTARDYEYGDRRLVAYIIPDQQRVPQLSRLLRLEREGLFVDRLRYELPNGMVIAAINRGETEFLYKEIFEEASYLRNGIRLDAGSCIFDIGANIGMFTLFAAEVCKKAVIYAFEPVPPVFDVLRANTTLFDLDVRLFQCGLSSDSKLETFTYYPHCSIISGRFADPVKERSVVRTLLLNEKQHPSDADVISDELVDELLTERLSTESFTCELKTISDVIRENGIERIDLLKVDVEKSEMDVLAGISDGDWKKIRQVVIEVHDIDGRLQTVVSLLKGHGYELAINEDSSLRDVGLYNVYAVRESAEKKAPAQPASLAISEVSRLGNSPNVLIKELRNSLKERLPEHMLPSGYLVMDHLPLTSSGKIDRRALPSVDPSRAEVFVAPASPHQQAIAAIWSDLLGINRIGVNDNFFDLGGHSLLATQVISRLRAVFKVELALRGLFEAPTIAGLSQRIEAEISAGQGLQAPAIERVEKGTGLPLSFAQQRLWFFNQMNPESRIYNILSAIKLEGELNVQSLERSLNEIVERHEILRTTFDMLDGEAVQVTSPSTSFNIHKILLQKFSDFESNDELSELIANEAHHVFNLKTGPLLRVTLVVLNQQEYVLLLNMHHIISDGWSMGVLIEELVTLYNAFTAGKPSPLPKLAIQYADYAVWQRNLLQDGSLESQLLYWKEQLQDAAPVLDLPTDRPRPAVQSHLGAFHTFFISRDVTRSLKALSQKEGCTLFMTLLALFDVLLCRYSGQNDILIGTPIANRNRVDIEKLIGVFVNTLVMRARVERGDSFLSLLKQQREVALGAYANQDLPFEKLVEEVQPERSLSHTPLFQVLLVLQNAPVEELRLPGLRVKSLDRQTRTSAFDMTMAVTEKAEGLSCSVEYNADLFDEATIVRMGGHFSRLAEEAVGNADLRVIEMRMLGEEERNQLLYEFNRTEREYPRRASIQEIFRHQAERLADKVAISEGDRQLSYGELNRAANRVASYLVDRGVGAETFVGLCMERSIEMIIATLGVLKAGGAYVPLDPTYPTQRLGFMLEDARPNVIICQEHFLEVLPGNKARIKKFEEIWEEASGYEAEEVGVEVDAECLAYVMYTSGSTGKPKGVSIPHRAVVWLVSSMDEVRVDETTIVAHGSNTAFDAATFEIWNTLLLGGQVEVVSKQTMIDGAALRGYVEERGIEVLYLTAALFAQVASQEPGAFSRLGCVLYGGEAVDPRWAREVLKAGGPDRLLHLMGTTETTVFSSWHVVKDVRADAKRLSMGAAMPNVKYYVLDEEMEPVAMGVGGELYLEGEGEGRRYLNRPDLTAERFIPNPYSEEPGRRMYATGDILRMDERGEIEFVRRKDDQVKIRGYRIELGEIEGEVRKQEGVRESVVIVDEGEQTGKRLVCYLVEKQRGMVNKEEMRRRLRLSLPEYMVPAIYEVIEEIPLTANGKVDKAKLPRVEAGHRSSQEDLIGPRDNIELQLIQIWEKILGARYIAVTDNFFDLGGHSLSALRLRYEIQTTFKYELSLNSLFQSPTIEHIAQLIRSSESALRSSSLIALRSTGSRPPFYCVHPGGGSVLCYLDLARSLGSDQPFYGLQSPGLEGEGEAYRCIEDMAARYIQEICSLQPEGPYFLGGWSLGGVIAFEMAHQLKGLGKQVALLALIDSYTPANDHDISRLEDDSELIGMFLRDFRGRLGKERAESNDDLKGKDTDWLLRYLLSEAKSLGVLPPDAGIEKISRLLNVFKANMNALKSYRPKAYFDRITLFRAETSSRNLLADNTSGWGDLTNDPIEVHLIPGNHYTMVARPNVQILAEKLGLCLERFLTSPTSMSAR